jgi:hypothetical protein
VRDVVLGTGDGATLARLRLLDLVEGDEASGDAIAGYEGYFVFDSPEQATDVHRLALLRQPVTQALIQGLHGRGTMAFDGALHFLARHRLARLDEATAVRSLLTILNKAKIVVWSAKMQTVRVVMELPEPSPDFEPVVRVIEKDRPFSNVMHLRQMLRSCEDYIHWAEPHLPCKALESLAVEADRAKISSIKLVSSPREVDEATRKDWKRFRTEMQALGITAEWRVAAPGTLGLHDRYVIGRRQVWNLPPVNSLHKGDYAEAFASPNRPPFDQWWNAATELGTSTAR